MSVLAFLYGICVLLIRSGTFTCVLWFGLAALFGLAAFSEKTHLLHRIPTPARITLHVVIACALLIFVCVEGLILSGFNATQKDHLDYVIVLGAQVRADGPSRVLQYRLDRALEYLEENPETICIVSGGQGPNELVTEADGMERYLMEKKLNAERILKENQSETTPENLRNSMQLFDADKASVGIVTNNFHMYRSLHLAKKSGVRDVCGIPAKSAPLYLPNNMLREFFGVLRDVILK